MNARDVGKRLVNAVLRPLGVQIVRRRRPSAGYEAALSMALSGPGRPLVLDIGANEGQAAQQILAVRPDAEVHSFEPFPEAYARLRSNVHGLHHHAYNFALGDTSGVAVLHTFSNSQTNSLLIPEPGSELTAPYLQQTREPVHVKVRRLDEFVADAGLEREVSYLKVDVQGFEDRVLRGAKRTLNRTRYAMIEAHFNRVYEGSCLVDEVVHLLRESGLYLQRTIGYLPGEDVDELISADLLFERVRAGNSK